MDKASDFESEDCEFESRRGRFVFKYQIGQYSFQISLFKHSNIRLSRSPKHNNMNVCCLGGGAVAGIVTTRSTHLRICPSSGTADMPSKVSILP